MIEIKVYEVVGENCITRNAGRKIYDLVHPELLLEHSVNLDFFKVRVFASPFFNAAIGRIFEDIQPQEFDRLVKVSNLSLDNQEVFERVVENSKKYYSDHNYREALEAALSEQNY